MSIRVWFYKAHQKVIFWFLKQGCSGARLAHAGFAATHMLSFQPWKLDMKEGWGLILDWSLDMTLADISRHLARKWVPQRR